MPRSPTKVFVAEDGTAARAAGSARPARRVISWRRISNALSVARRRHRTGRAEVGTAVLAGMRSAQPLRARLPARPGRPRADAARRGRLAACRRLAVLSLVMVARGKIRQARCRTSTRRCRVSGRGTRTGRSHPPHLRQSRSRAAGRAAQLVAAGGRRPLPATVQRRAHRPRAASGPSRFPGADVAASAFIRVERQTLRKLPASGDILFTIRIHLDPMKVLESHPDRAALAASFAAQLAALDKAQLDYKGLTADRDRLVALPRRRWPAA